MNSNVTLKMPKENPGTEDEPFLSHIFVNSLLALFWR